MAEPKSRFTKVEFSASEIDALLELLQSRQTQATFYSVLEIVKSKLTLARDRVEVAPDA